jgi:hypothetical protein
MFYIFCVDYTNAVFKYMLNRINNIPPDHAEKNTKLNTIRKIALQNNC